MSGHGLYTPGTGRLALRPGRVHLSLGAPAVVFPSLAIATLTISVNLLIDNLPRKIRDQGA